MANLDEASLSEALAAAITAGIDGLQFQSHAFFNPQFPRLIEFATSFRLPVMGWSAVYPRNGGLMSYGVDLRQNNRRGATFVDKILKGANPGDLPIERPLKYEFVINLKAAQAIGLTIPRSVLQQATEVIS